MSVEQAVQGKAWISTRHAFDRIKAPLAFNAFNLSDPPCALALAFSNHLLE